jgi:hypothetical protein
MKKIFLAFLLLVTFMAFSLIYATYTIAWYGHCSFNGTNPVQLKVDEDMNGTTDHHFFFPPNDPDLADKIKDCLAEGHDVGIWFHVDGGLNHIDEIRCWNQ